MRTASFAFVFVIAISGLAAAQDWTEYQNIPDGFKVAFPGQPKVTDTTWTTEYGYKAPAHVYSAERGKERYTLTVVDYNAIEAQGIERRKGCPPGAEPCVGSDISGPGYWKHDIRGAMIFAAKQYLQRDVKMTNYTWQHQDLIEGAELQLTSNADQSARSSSSRCTRTSCTSSMARSRRAIRSRVSSSSRWDLSTRTAEASATGRCTSNEIYGLKEAPTPSYGGGGGAPGQGQGGGGRRGGGAGSDAQQP